MTKVSSLLPVSAFTYQVLFALLGLLIPLLAFAQSLNTTLEDDCFETGNPCDVFTNAETVLCDNAANVESCVCGAANLYGLAIALTLPYS